MPVPQAYSIKFYVCGSPDWVTAVERRIEKSHQRCAISSLEGGVAYIVISSLHRTMVIQVPNTDDGDPNSFNTVMRRVCRVVSVSTGQVLQNAKRGVRVINEDELARILAGETISPRTRCDYTVGLQDVPVGPGKTLLGRLGPIPDTPQSGSLNAVSPSKRNRKGEQRNNETPNQVLLALSLRSPAPEPSGFSSSALVSLGTAAQQPAEMASDYLSDGAPQPTTIDTASTRPVPSPKWVRPTAVDWFPSESGEASAAFSIAVSANAQTTSPATLSSVAAAASGTEAVSSDAHDEKAAAAADQGILGTTHSKSASFTSVTGAADALSACNAATGDPSDGGEHDFQPSGLAPALQLYTQEPSLLDTPAPQRHSMSPLTPEADRLATPERKRKLPESADAHVTGTYPFKQAKTAESIGSHTPGGTDHQEPSVELQLELVRLLKANSKTIAAYLVFERPIFDDYSPNAMAAVLGRICDRMWSTIAQED